MSDNIPFEIQVEIFKRLPIKSLIQFRSVSKPWKSLIDSSEFIANYKVHHSQPQRLLVSYCEFEFHERKYVLIDDDDTFPQRKCSLTAPMVIEWLEDPKFLGTSHGLLCFYGYYDGEDDSSRDTGYFIVVLWNPSIQKSVAVKVPDQLEYPYGTVLGFGVCPHTYDPKIVKINYIRFCDEWRSISCIPLQVEVFSLRSGAWRIPFGNLPRKSIGFGFGSFEEYQIAIDGFIYWIVFDRTNVDDFEEYNLIISFDLTSEIFREIYLPEYLAQQSRSYNLSISKLRDSPVVLDRSGYGGNLVYGVWMMEHGVTDSFTKLFTLYAPFASLYKVLGFGEKGELMLEMCVMNENFTGDLELSVMYADYTTKLEVYEPSSKHIKDLGIYGGKRSFSVSSYMETLILLDHRGGRFYSNM